MPHVTTVPGIVRKNIANMFELSNGIEADRSKIKANIRNNSPDIVIPKAFK